MRCFSSPGSPLEPMNSVPNTLIDQRQSLNSRPRLEKTTPKGHGLAKVEGGFPHSEIHGSMPVRGSPWLIAAYHVLHRLSAPRHPPDTLKTLDRSHYRCPTPTDPRRIDRTAPTRGHRAKMRGSHKDLCFCPNLSGTGGGQASRHHPQSIERASHPASRDAGGELDRVRGGVDPSASGHTPGFARRAARPDGRTHSLFTMSKNTPRSLRAEAMRQPDTPVANCDMRTMTSGLSCRASAAGLRLPVSRPPCPAPPGGRWWSKTGSNRRPHACKARALPTELLPQGVGEARGSARHMTGGPGKTRTSDLTLIKRAL